MKFTMFVLALLSCSVCFAGNRTTTYYNRNGSIQFRATENRGSIRTYDSRGTFSGSYQRSSNSVRQTCPGFSGAKANSTFIRRK